VTIKEALNLANALKAAGRTPEAVDAYRRASELFPGSAEPHNNLGNTLRDMGNLAEAARELGLAAALKPNDGMVQYNYGNVLADIGEPRKALEAYSRAAKLKPDLPGARWGRSWFSLLHGDFVEGWKDYHWHWAMRAGEPLHRTDFLKVSPEWDGSELGGKRIVLYADQAFGDAIQFVRYLPMVAQRGGRIIVACHIQLIRVLQTMGVAEQWVASGQAVPAHDVNCPLTTLPALFKTSLADMPAKVPYLTADVALSRQWRKRMPADGRLKVGLVWAGGLLPLHRSIPPTLLAPLATVPNVWFCSVQKKIDGQKYDPVPIPMADWTDELYDLADTAALIDNLDLIVTIDTSVAHLAGAMGKRTWVLLKNVPDWRWMLDRADSPWYPTMRLFRQPRPGEWSEPIAQVMEALKNL